MPRLLTFLAMVFMLFGGWYGWLFWKNNVDGATYSVPQLEKIFERSIGWLEANQSNLIETETTILWWMISESGKLTGQEKLSAFAKQHELLHIAPNPRNGWALLFDSHPSLAARPLNSLANLAPYQKFFIYGLTCDDRLGQKPIIRQQLDPNFCTDHFLHPRCVTHQLVGVRFMQRNSCGQREDTELLVRQLQDTIVRELTWDPRMGDAYIQRVLMLVESGALDRVKPIWIQRVLESQNTDGGWGDIDPIIYLPDERVIGFGSKGLVVASLKSDFHATAQGIWLVSLLLAEHDSNIYSAQHLSGNE